MVHQAFRLELLERFPTLDSEIDASLFKGLSDKHKRTLQKQGPQATADVAGRDVDKYLGSKAVFLEELSSYGLDTENIADRRFALELWDEHSYSIVVADQDAYYAARDVQRDVDSYLLGKKAAIAEAGATALASRFVQEDLEPMVKSGQKQQEFMLAFGEFLSKALQLDRGVLEFRRDVLGDSGNTISHNEADDLVRSPAARSLSMESFNKTGISLIGHTADFVPREDGSHLLQVEASGMTATLSGGEPQEQFRFHWFTKEGFLTRPLVERSSILGRLGKLSEALTKHHPIGVEEAAYFILCGSTLQPRSIWGRIDNNNFVPAGAYTYNHSTITLTVGSWMSPEQVRQAYAKLRRQATAKNTYRSKSDKNIPVFRFVIERATLKPPRDLVLGTRGVFRFPPWRQLVEEWNKQYPSGHRERFDQSGYTAEKMFRNAFTAGYRAVTGLKYYAPTPIATREEVDSIMRKLKTRT